MSPSLAASNDSATLASDPTSSPFIDPRGESPIRAELYGLDRLEALARLLASAGVVDADLKAGDHLLRRFVENGRILVRTHARIVGESDRPEGRGIDADWLADNFHIVEEVLREIKHDLPGGYYAELPKLAVGHVRGYPRVYTLALALVSHTDSELDEPRITRFLRSFQSVEPLTIGELWAIPTMLRLVLIENLRRLADRMVRSWDETRIAESWIAQHFGEAEIPEGAEAPRPERAHPSAETAAFPSLTNSTIVRLVQLLRDRGASAAPILKRLENELSARGVSSNRVLREEHRRQAANQVSVGNCVISLRLLSAVDWNDFFEQNSEVEVVLREDPSGVYPRQDFATRDRCRRAVEGIARRSKSDEQAVARRALEMAEAGSSDGPARGCVAYYLIDRGVIALRREFGYRGPIVERLEDFARAHPRRVYFGSIVLIMACLIAAMLAWVGSIGVGGGIGLMIVAILALLLPASDIAVGMVNHVVTLLMPPRKLARLDFKGGIAEDCATIVVVPSMLVRADSAANLLERLEITYLANPDPRLRFALLTDFADAKEEQRPEDEGFILGALDGVRALNARYAGDGPDRFFLFHRRRTWNPVQGCWMGWERKRGKLSEFNRLIRGDRETNYVIQSGDPALLPRMRFVITLDADTILPRESARRLVGTLAHPLNAPRFDPARGLVVEGHGVLQPRVSYHLFAATRSRFAGLLASSAGIDPYSNAISDIYMDLFDSGSFTGKGIYEVDAFEAANGHTFPENQILSHDLIEGNYARCGLVTDVELFDDFPPRYHAYALREHRWARGDWQLLPWLGRTVPTLDGPRPNPLPVLERWKIFDNLRRSLVPPALMVLLVLGWTILPGSPWLWTGFALAVMFLPIFQLVLGSVYSAARGRSFSPIVGIAHNFPATAGQSLLWVAFLADQARRLVDATLRTLHRLHVSKRRLLEWETAAATEHRLGTGLANFVRTMWPSPALALALGALVAVVNPPALSAALPVLLAWFVAPVVAYWVSLPRRASESSLTDADRSELRRIARKTWHFFETFVGDEDHWLPPDNFQEDSINPGGRVAHRTSPTNKGMLLLSTLAAHDLGYLGLRTMLDRLEKSFDTFDRLETHEGHFFNWYNTQTLKTLPPNYISTVDSGNFLGCLVTLKQGMREKLREPIPGPRAVEGLIDTLAVLVEDVRAGRSSRAGEEYKEFDAAAEEVRALLVEVPADLSAWDDLLGHLEWSVIALLSRVRALTGVSPSTVERWEGYARRLENLVRDRRAEVASVTPWVASLRSSDETAFAVARRRSGEFDRAWQALRSTLAAPGSPAELATRASMAVVELTLLESSVPEGDGHDPAIRALRELAEGARASIAPDLVARCTRLAERSERLGSAMDFRFLYKEDRHLFSIGQNMVVGRLDPSCYDLMASEACLSSFLAICRGDAPRRHWFQLGRPFIEAADRVGLLSWGGSMFEYLMPRLMLRPLDGTLLDEAHRTAVARQIEYGRQQGVPWGISESAYATFSVDGDYQYRSFGTPGLGLKRDIGEDLVIAPYATALAVAIRPREAMENFRRLAAEGAEGRYGFHEAVDYTKGRVPKGKRSVVIRSYMAHHHGMSLVALANALQDDVMPRRFHAEPMVRAADLLLQERVPRDAPIIEPSAAEGPSPSEPRVETSLVPLMSRRLSTPSTPSPRTHLLSNTQYNVMITGAGSGYSTCRGIDVTRWREDSTRDASGLFFYIRDVMTDAVWSAGYQPTCRPADHYEAIFSADKISFRRLDGGIETVTEITVSPESRAEIRRLTLTNHDTRTRELELTSYAEVVLLPHGADLSHPAFGKLFLETEWIASSGGLICRRRPRSEDQEPIWAVHVAASDAPSPTPIQFETDRARFLGRGRSPADPCAMDPGATLSGTTGAVLDPIFSLRRRVRIEPGLSATVAFTTAVADSRDEAITLADHYRETSAIARAFELAWAHSQVEHRSRNWSAQDSHLFQRLASNLIYAGTILRADPAILGLNTKGQPGLWAYGISGDLPIVAVLVDAFDDLALVVQLLVAHTFLRLKGLEFDLVILGGPSEGDADEFQQHILEIVRGSDARDLLDKPGGIFVRKIGVIPEEDRVLIQSYARVVFHGNRGNLVAQLDRMERVRAWPEPLVPSIPMPDHVVPEAIERPDLLFFNGVGGFSPDGLEYRVILPASERPDIRRNGRADRQNLPRPILPPAPWVNVVANPDFGFIASEGGSGYTWAGNSQSNRLTPWSNDPVTDPPGEVVYLRDEESGDFWCPTSLPVPSDEPTFVRHGQGYTTYQRKARGLDHELTLLVPPTDPIKVIHLRVSNPGDRPRQLSATFYAEWVLGGVRDLAAMHVITSADPETGALLARNPFHPDFSDRTAFVDASRRPITFTCDRAEFLGRNGSLAEPAALGRVELGGVTGPGHDPCAAIQVKFEIKPGCEERIVFVLGQAASVEEARRLIALHRDPARFGATLDEVKALWDQALGRLQVKTPDQAMDLVLNRWLVYQALSCRFWGRSATYQSGGAYGFRDQLQDSMALVYGSPHEARAQILRSASRQFVEGDVQHWWHPPAGKGVRTRISDDLIWLPFVACHYATTTGDNAIFDEVTPYLEAPLLKPGQEDEFGLPAISKESGTLYEHCIRALDRAHQLGTHGLPLMGTGDWNDGMNRVGSEGRGESVWNAWFLIDTLRHFGEVARSRGDAARDRICVDSAEALRVATEAHAWDGQWYRRAYFDDGTPLGSSSNDECQIDSLGQSWAAISGVADPDRVRQAMASVDERLVKDEDGLILLFTPPFDHGKLHPGYIKGYVPGVRENGGQYTHAATWVAMAAAIQGRGGRAVELFGLINPIRHATDPASVALYKVEPYVVAADVYGRPPHTGRGGWTWYTGSASWLYRVGVESILGFHLRGDHLAIDPRIPAQWPGFEIAYRHRSTPYRIVVENPEGVEHGVGSATLDGQPVDPAAIPLAEDGLAHEVRIVLGGGDAPTDRA
ncbi:GH36-type glycosyl hydrolase domain-containing protein [Tundrisphaera lichenicola]|uniref:GH36-type glycosyl hydrolase domain-containing protein n=1 Tax=Tundrisphaera lichenicola TaxID=2029860 RepID=UPI003EBA33C9